MPRHYLPKINKYATLAASMPVALSGGLAYCFGIWSPALKAAYHLDQTQLESIGAWHNLGGYSSIISGFVYDALEHRHHVGPRLSLALGALTNVVGFLGLWAAITHRFLAQTWHLAVLAFLAGNGGTWADTSTLSTNLRNFPASRGTVVGIIKAAVGLSASLYTAAYTGVFQPRSDLFLLFLAIVPLAVALITVPLINYVPYVQESELQGGYTIFSPDGRFLMTLQTVGTLALYLMATALTDALGDVSEAARSIMALGAVFLLLPFIAIPLGSGGLFARKHGMPDHRDPGSAAQHNRSPEDNALVEHPLLAIDDSGEDSEGGVIYGPSLSVRECLEVINFWLLALVCGVGIGCGLAFLNNCAQLVTALGGPPEARGVLVSLFGVASCGGRLLFGIVPEKALHRYGIPRPAFLTAVGAFTTGVLASLAFAGMSVLYPLAGAAGLAFGAHWSLLPSLASELFGLDNFASIYTTLQLAPAVGNYGFGAVLIGKLYQEAIRRHGDPEATTCVGPDCFRTAFLVMAGCAGAATCASIWLCVRTLGMYKAEIAALRALDNDRAVHECILE